MRRTSDPGRRRWESPPPFPGPGPEPWWWTRCSDAAVARYLDAYEQRFGHDAPPPAEVAVFRTTWRSEGGLNCLFYEPLNQKTAHLREELFVTVEAEFVLFRPRGAAEHFPLRHLIEVQAENDRTGHGAGRDLGLEFVCYAPEGSGVAEEGRRVLEEGLEELRLLANLSAFSHNAIAARYRKRYMGAMWRPPEAPLPPPAYRPPPDAEPREVVS